jgi:GNAT superfamily N-acetyltransferase
MQGATTSDRDRLLAFELALDEQVCDEVRVESWGRAFLTPSASLVWDSNWVGIERTGMALAEVFTVADEVLGGAGFDHRTICALDEADGRRLGALLEAEAAAWPGWEVERTRYMLWRGGEIEAGPARSHLATTVVDNCERTGAGGAGPGAREVRLAEIAGLRMALIGESMPAGVEEFDATVDQLLDLNCRYADAGGDRWFVAPADGEPASACCLLRGGGIGQVEDVGTLAPARERGYAKAIVLTAVAAAQAAGDTTIFLTAEADDWPQLFYARLGFETIGDITILRRRP